MKINVITFAGTTMLENKKNRDYLAYGIFRDYTSEAKRFIETTKPYKFNNRLILDMEWLEKTKEYKENPKTFAEPPFHWAFKPISIYYTMEKLMSDGDVLLYADSNYGMRNYPQRLIDIALQENIYAYDHSPVYYQNACWTYRDTFVKMKCDEEKYWKAPQFHADVLCIKKCKSTMNFIEEWKKYVCDYETIGVNNLINFPCYNDHRDDQSVFSILAVKHNIKISKKPNPCLIELPPIDLKNRDFKNAPYR